MCVDGDRVPGSEWSSPLLWEGLVVDSLDVANPKKIVMAGKEVKGGPEEQAADLLAIPLWGRLLIKYLKWAGGVIVAGFITIAWQLVSLNRSIGNVEGQIARMPATLSQSLAAEAVKYVRAGKTHEAASALTSATHLLLTATKAKSDVSPDYFPHFYALLASLDAPELSEEVHSACTQLADFRSATTRPPSLPPITLVAHSVVSLSDFEKNLGFKLIKTTPGPIFRREGMMRTLANAPTIIGGAFKGGVDGVTQELDGFKWEGNIFINVQIKYNGGEVLLEDVSFVNCTFDFPNSPQGNLFAKYIVLRSLHLRIG
jgi:hypothetical protein